MRNVMIDLETLDTASTAVILAIGAVQFDGHGTSRELYTPVDIQSCLDAKLTISASTFRWWLTQDEAARQALADTEGAPDIYSALDALRNGFDWNDTLAWGNGADFDLSILANAYKMFGEQPPWQYYNTRCYRTLKSSVSKERYNALKVLPSVAHHALADARAQAETAIRLMAA